MLAAYRNFLFSPATSCPFVSPTDVVLINTVNGHSLRVSFTDDNIISISIDARTGKIVLRAQDDSGTSVRKDKLLSAETRLEQALYSFGDVLARLRYQVN